MKIDEKINFWKRKAKECYKIAEGQYGLRNYLWCLFFCHLSLEKILKAIVIKQTKKDAPYTHDLLILARLAKIELSLNQADGLKIITSFSIETRYTAKINVFASRVSPLIEAHIASVEEFNRPESPWLIEAKKYGHPI
jgi:HEPN domain-containing protein